MGSKKNRLETIIVYVLIKEINITEEQNIVQRKIVFKNDIANRKRGNCSLSRDPKHVAEMQFRTKNIQFPSYLL